MTHQVANYPAMLRYKTPKSYWQAMRLGLYQTVVDYKSVLSTKKSKVSFLIAQLKRFCFNDAQATEQISKILSDRSYQKLHKELIKDTFYLYPQIYTQIFVNHSHFFDDEYYQGLALSYQYHQKKALAPHQFFKNLDNVNKSLLFSNAYLDNPIKKVNQLNIILANHQLTPIQLKDDNNPFCIANFKAIQPTPIQKNAQVSILVTAYNATATIEFCIESLFNQSYQNLQIIIINDHSCDDTWQKIERLAKKDNRIMGINLPKNTGTFVAKNIGAMYATGEFLTCHDADDVAHPQKIERQVLPLLANNQLIASTSYWVRIDEGGNYYAHKLYPLLRQNPASPLFRRQQVQNELGLWHNAKTGADSEFWERLLLVYGKDKITIIKEPLTFGLHRADSLMNSSEFGVHHQGSALARLDYWEAWRLWHIDCLANGQFPIMPKLGEQIEQKMFKIPHSLVVDIDDIRYNLTHHTKIEPF